MAHNSLLVIVHTFPEVQKYLNDYIQSINEQTFIDFDILIVNQGLKKNYFEKLNKKPIIINVKKNKSVAEMRQIGWDYFYNKNYKYLICSDADDFFSNDRVEKSFIKLQNNNFAYNELIKVNNKGKLLSKKKTQMPTETVSIYNILHMNYIGGSSSAFKKTKRRIIKIPKHIIATDWYIASIYLINNYKGGLIKNSYTYYRQHNNNVIGLESKLSSKSLDLILKVKLSHYKGLLNYCKSNKSNVDLEHIQNTLLDYRQLSNFLQKPNFKKKYISSINDNYDKIYNFWWSDLITIDRYENLK